MPQRSLWRCNRWPHIIITCTTLYSVWLFCVLCHVARAGSCISTPYPSRTHMLRTCINCTDAIFRAKFPCCLYLIRGTCSCTYSYVRNSSSSYVPYQQIFYQQCQAAIQILHDRCGWALPPIGHDDYLVTAVTFTREPQV